jgi:ATP/ADP translocase
MFNYKMTLVINTFLTVSFITFGNGVLNNPNLFNVAIFTLIVIMQTILFFGDIEKKND